MCNFGGGGTSSSGNQFGFQNTTSTYSPDPMAYNYLMSVLQAGSNTGAIPYEAYTGTQVAGFSQDQLAGMQAVREATGAAQPYLDQATQLAAQAYNLSSPSNFSQAAVSQYLNPMMTDFINKTPTVFTQAAADQYLDPRLQSMMNLLPTQYSTAAAAQYQDPTIQNMINALPTGYSQAYANQFMSPQLKAYLEGAPLQYSPEAVSKYYNPYQESVINATKAQIEQQNAQQMAQQQAQAIQSGAFGGDRSGAARAQLAGQQALAQNQTLGALRQQGYQQALAAFQQQQAQALGIASQQQALGVNQFNTQQALRSALAQQQAQQQMEMFSRQQGLGIDIAKQQAQQKLQQFNQQQAAALNAQQQSYAQALAQYNQQQQQAIQAAQQASYGLSQLGAQAQQAQLQGAQALLGSGQLQQQQMQQEANKAYSNWLAAKSYPYMQTAFQAGLADLATALGGTTNTTGVGYNTSNQTQSGGSKAGQIGGGLLSMFGSLGLWSDERAKTNIDYVGEDPKSGYPIYAYDYKSDVERSEKSGKPMPPKRMGPMAQDVAERDPEHSIDLGGLLGIKLDRDHKADGGQTKMVPIQTYTGQAAPSTGITDLSSLAYQTDPNFPVDMTQGLGDLFTPMEEYEKIGKRWVSPDLAEDKIELKPFKASHEDREERAIGGELTDQSDFLEMSKSPPYGILSNPKVASSIRPVHKLPEHRPQAPDLGFVPGLPGGAKSMSGGAGGGGGGETPSIPKLGSKAKSALGLGSLGSTGSEKTDAAKTEAEKTEPSFFDKLKGGIGDIFSGGAQAPEAPVTPAAPDVSSAGGDTFGGIGNLFSGLFSHGGRAEMAAGGGLPGFGGITGSQIGPITDPYGTGKIGGYPAGVGAFNTPVNTGITVQQAFGPRGLGRDIPQSLANFRMPWTAVNTGSPTYNNLLLQASKNIGPRQLTPQEFGLPSIAQASANYSANSFPNKPTQAQIDATTDEVEKANLQNQLDIANLQNKYPKLAINPSNYIYQMTEMLTPSGNYFQVPVSGYNSPSVYVNPFAKSQPQYKADGGSVREGYRQGGRPGLWGRLQDAEESARAAALALKEDAMHPQEVLHSIWNRVKSGAYGETPSDVMTQRRQYEPMNPSNRGTSRDPRTVNPNDPKVRELADYWSKIKAGQVEDPTGGATHFMNPDIVGQRRHGHFKPWERAGLNDPASVRVGQQIFYNPNRNAPVASDRPKGDYFSNLKPPVPYGPGDMSVLAGGQGKYGEPISPVSAPLNDTFGKGLDLSGGAMNMREMSDVYPVEPPGVAGRNIGAGDRELSIGQLSGLPSLADPATPGTYSPPLNVGGTDVQTAMGNERPKGFADVPPILGQPTSEADKITEVHDGRHPMVKTTAVAHPRPGTHVVAEKSTGFGPVARDKGKKGEEGGFDLEDMLGDVFGGKDAGYLQGPDLGDLADLLGFNAGGRVGYEEGGDVDPLDVYMAALAKGESGGEKDPYRTIGPASRKGDRPYGKYQIMGENIPAWSEEAGVGRITPEEFLASDKLQEQIARHKYGQYLKETGSPEKAAAMWFGGPNYASHMGAKDVLGTSIPQYMASFKSRLGEGDGGGGSHVVATDRGNEGSDDTFGGLRHMLGGDKEAGTGLFGMKPLMNRDLAMYLLATGSGMMASRNKSPLAAFGEGSMQGIEALQASQAMRANEGLKGLQAANLMSEIQKRNFELNELIRRTRARQQLLGGAGGEGAPKAVPPVSQDTGVAPGAMPTTPEAPKIIEGTPAAPAAAPEAKPAPVSPEIPVSGAPKEEAMKPDPFDAEMAKVTADEKLNRQKAQQAIDLGIPEDAKQFEDRADKARDRVEKLMEQKRQSLTQKVDEGSPMGQYSATQKAAASAVDRQHILKDLEATINDKSVDFGIAAPYLNMLKSGAAEAEEYFPGLKKILPPVNTEALARAEELGAEANNIILSFTNGKLGGGVTDADMRILRDTTFNVSKTREYNMNVLRKAEAVQEKVKAAAEEQERYRQAHGGLDANFQDHMSKWGKEHPVQSYMRKEAEHKAGQIGEKEAPVAKDRTIVKRGTKGGRPVVLYSDGTAEYAD